MSTYTAKYSSESINFIIPIIALAFLGMVYIMSQRAGSEFVSFILIAGATLPMIYWIVVVKRMTLKSSCNSHVRTARTGYSRENTVYHDLIKKIQIHNSGYWWSGSTVHSYSFKTSQLNLDFQ